MLHWYRLVQLGREERFHTSGEQSHLVAGRGDLPTASLSDQQREKLFWLGLIEAVPLFGGGVFSIFADSNMQAIVAAVVAVVLTLLVCWLLRHHVPSTRIQLSTQRPNPAMQPTASGRTAQLLDD